MRGTYSLASRCQTGPRLSQEGRQDCVAVHGPRHQSPALRRVAEQVRLLLREGPPRYQRRNFARAHQEGPGEKPLSFSYKLTVRLTPLALT